MINRFKIIICSLLLCTQATFAQSTDSSKFKKDNYSFVGLMPLFAGIVTFGQPQEFADVYVPGLSLSYGKANGKWFFGANGSYRHYFIEGWKDANEYSAGPFAEYHFRPEKKATWLIGLKAYILVWQYSPQAGGLQFFNDPPDGKSRTRFIPTLLPYAGGDFKIRKKFHLAVGVGYDIRMISHSGAIPFVSPINVVADFRIPVGKRR